MDMQSLRGGTMTDKELLELAAKAVGFVPAFNYLPKTNALIWLAKSGTPATWRPLLDSKEAFELAVKLQMEISTFDNGSSCVSVSFKVGDRYKNFDVCVKHEQDAEAATRRAIVLVAAEIGKNL